MCVAYRVALQRWQGAFSLCLSGLVKMLFTYVPGSVPGTGRLVVFFNTESQYWRTFVRKKNWVCCVQTILGSSFNTLIAVEKRYALIRTEKKCHRSPILQRMVIYRHK